MSPVTLRQVFNFGYNYELNSFSKGAGIKASAITAVLGPSSGEWDDEDRGELQWGKQRERDSAEERPWTRVT